MPKGALCLRSGSEAAPPTVVVSGLRRIAQNRHTSVNTTSTATMPAVRGVDEAVAVVAVAV